LTKQHGFGDGLFSKLSLSALIFMFLQTFVPPRMRKICHQRAILGFTEKGNFGRIKCLKTRTEVTHAHTNDGWWEADNYVYYINT
jgi:hypothetical protein